MKAQKHATLGYVVTDGAHRYIETDQAEPTNRVLASSYDNDFDEEWIGYGTIDGVPVRATYLIDYDQQGTDDDQYDWAAALGCGRLKVRVDDLTEEEFATLTNTGELHRA